MKKILSVREIQLLCCDAVAMATAPISFLRSRTASIKPLVLLSPFTPNAQRSMSSKGKKTEQVLKKRAYKVQAAEEAQEEISLHEDPPATQANVEPDDPIEEEESNEPIAKGTKRKAQAVATEGSSDPHSLNPQLEESLYQALVTLGNFVETNNFGMLRQEVVKCNQLLAKKPKGQGAVYASMNRVWMQMGAQKEAHLALKAEIEKIKEALKELYIFKRRLEPEFDRTKGMADRNYSWMKWMSAPVDEGGKGFKQPPKPLNGGRISVNELKGQEWLFGAPDVEEDQA